MENRFFYRKRKDLTVLSASISDFRYKTHAHKEYALGVTLRGIQQYNSKWGLLSSHKDGVMLFNPEQAHDGMAFDKNGIDYVMLYIEPDQFLEILEVKDKPLFSSPIVYNSDLEKKILDISSSVLSPKDDLLCDECLSSLAEHFNPSLFEHYKKDFSLAGKAKQMIKSNVKGVKLEEICSELDLSKFQFIRMFKSSTGITPYQFYLSFKIETAKHIIEKTRDVYSAVESCNYVDLTHLNKHFKNTYGITAFSYLQCLQD